MVERVEKPKRKLAAMLERRDGRFTPGAHHTMSIALNDLGANIPLERLRDVPSYRAFERELVQGLVILRLVPEGSFS